jgi:hypothetical protein
MNYVIGVGDKGFQPDLISGALHMLNKQGITTLISTYSCTQHINVIEEYEENSFWLNFVS